MRWVWKGLNATCEAAPNLTAEITFTSPVSPLTITIRDSGHPVGSEEAVGLVAAQRIAQAWLDRYGWVLVRHPTKDSPGVRDRDGHC